MKKLFAGILTSISITAMAADAPVGALPPASAVPALEFAFEERVTLDAEHAGRFLSGVRRRGDWPNRERVAVFGPSPTDPTQSVLLGTAHTQGGELIAGRLLSPTDIQQIL